MTKPDFTVIENKKEIKRVQRAFAKNMKKEATKHGELTASHQHGGLKVHAYWFKDNEFWWAYPKTESQTKTKHSNTPNWWNAFRFLDSNHQYYPNRKAGEPNWGGVNGMTVQINSPISGNKWSFGGCFVKDPNNEIYIAHTGKIGGGREGIGRGLFVANYPGTQQWREVTGSRGKKQAVIISSINSHNLISNVGLFVKAVAEIKELPKSKKSKKSKSRQRKLTPFGHGEFSGTRTYSIKDQVEQRVDHGKVVKRIAEICKELGYSVSRSQIDLYVEGKLKKSVLMEIKTRNDTQSRYKAIGQLLYYSFVHVIPKNTKKVVVFPKPKILEFEKVLGKLGIKYITYTKTPNKKPKFDSTLDKILKDL